uniref:Uncharacterized protein n=1 Tax=Candidatus Kentrum sp. TUN TaxID=2126343 RepID=A0A450Z9L2_9GAMM|nr:MAG: hypothetical protein BECKTUN1418E_GA0071001_100333 [Candidatus Kentron sp. TUN]VFK51730.1 MAG: hypothetical protein BECKTUN1418F_GA0071002_100333 [Candidatus Kentron sp. TUN]VFK56592.1 MAG: hypothetical protein BECKTUN1418D_GA0071000_10506 [Candidatus Kentron sp. TUN]
MHILPISHGNMLALRAKVDRGLTLLHAWVLSGFLFFRYIEMSAPETIRTSDLPLHITTAFAANLKAVRDPDFLFTIGNKLNYL